MSIQDRFDLLMKELPTIRLGYEKIASVRVGADELAICWTKDLHAQVHLAGVGMVAEARADYHAPDAKVTLWRDLRLAFIGWMEKKNAQAVHC